MKPINVLNSPSSSSPAGVAAQDIQTLAAGQARSLHARTPMALRVMRGRAWVTIEAEPEGAGGQAAGDVFLHAGQTFWVGARQHLVLEPLGQGALQFCWRAAGAVRHDVAENDARAGWPAAQASGTCGA
ncbi:DUF2917 domain-containing protein [Acidovorax sp. Leaf160]|uniref:DUF2917 domain-containing protein n=1 Tax=Acidovorax sp. Leaf160 TaxID=1736280 RepID=UPI0009E92049|nr:DUF2917 domain-containing protein [Acidovorax sp. Leaf160]